MKYLPLIFALFVYGIMYNVMSNYTEKMWAYPEIYCQLNSSIHEHNVCTKNVVVAGYLIFILPIIMSLGTFVITRDIQKKEKELIKI